MTRQEILTAAKPILFNTEMVRAILDGRKTVTRRVIKPQPAAEAPMYCYAGCDDHIGRWHDKGGQWWTPPCHADDYLYVRETWAKLDNHYFYKAGHELLVDGEPLIKMWKPSIHMPKEAARIFLRVGEVRAKRLQELNGNDLKKEGIKTGITHFKSPINNFGNVYRYQEAMKVFSSLWDSTIKKSDLPLYGWEANSWVWVIEFERVFPNK